MKGRNRWIMGIAIALAILAVTADHIRHRPPVSADTGMERISEHDEDDTPCTTGMHHDDEDEDDEL